MQNIESRGKHDEHEVSSKMDVIQLSELDAMVLKRDISGENKYDLLNSPTSSTNKQIAENSDFKDIPEMFQMLNLYDWTRYNQIQYKVYKDFKQNRHNTRCKPVAVYTSLVRTITVPNQASYTLKFRKGSSTVKTWTRETTLSVGGMFKGIDMSASVTTGYSYSNSYEEEESEELTQILEAGNYMMYQNKVIYAYEVQTASYPYDASNIEYLFNNQYDWDRGCPYVYRNGDRLFYFVDFNMNHPFIKKYSTQLYEEPKMDEIARYLVGRGWYRW